MGLNEKWPETGSLDAWQSGGLVPHRASIAEGVRMQNIWLRDQRRRIIASSVNDYNSGMPENVESQQPQGAFGAPLGPLGTFFLPPIGGQEWGLRFRFLFNQYFSEVIGGQLDIQFKTEDGENIGEPAAVQWHRAGKADQWWEELVVEPPEHAAAVEISSSQANPPSVVTTIIEAVIDNPGVYPYVSSEVFSSVHGLSDDAYTWRRISSQHEWLANQPRVVASRAVTTLMELEFFGVPVGMMPVHAALRAPTHRDIVLDVYSRNPGFSYNLGCALWEVSGDTYAGGSAEHVDAIVVPAGEGWHQITITKDKFPDGEYMDLAFYSNVAPFQAVPVLSTIIRGASPKLDQTDQGLAEYAPKRALNATTAPGSAVVESLRGSNRFPRNDRHTAISNALFRAENDSPTYLAQMDFPSLSVSDHELFRPAYIPGVPALEAYFQDPGDRPIRTELYRLKAPAKKHEPSYDVWARLRFENPYDDMRLWLYVNGQEFSAAVENDRDWQRIGRISADEEIVIEGALGDSEGAFDESYVGASALMLGLVVLANPEPEDSGYLHLDLEPNEASPETLASFDIRKIRVLVRTTAEHTGIVTLRGNGPDAPSIELVSGTAHSGWQGDWGWDTTPRNMSAFIGQQTGHGFTIECSEPDEVVELQLEVG